MRHTWLTFLTIGFISAVVILFFWVSLRPIEQPEPEQDIEPGSLEEPTVTFVNPRIGPADAPVTIIEFGDFQCSACKEANEPITRILEEYPEQVRFVWKHMPNDSVHELASRAAVASQCAFEQDRFWEYYDRLFAQQAFLNEQSFEQIAREMDMDVDAFEGCLAAQETLPVVQKDIEEGVGLGITATPTIFINDERITGAPTTGQLRSYVEEALDTE